MTELQARGMERLPPKSLQRLGPGPVPAAVERIADHRATDMGEMNTDLMRAPCLQFGADQAGKRRQWRAEALFNPVLGHRRLSGAAAAAARAGTSDRHALAIDRMAGDGSL